MVVRWRCVGEEDSCTEIVMSDGGRHTIYSCYAGALERKIVAQR
jgi:hypothetical protein